MDPQRKLIRSPHVGFFCRRDAVFAYLNCSGDILEMSADIRDFVVAFGADGRISAQVIADAGLDPSLAATMVDTLVEHGLLVAVDADQVAEIAARVPVIAPWACFAEIGGSVVVVRGRSLRTAPTLEKLSAWQLRVWRHVDGERSAGEIAALLDGRDSHAKARPGTLRRVCETLLEWTSVDRQWTRISPVPMRFYRRGVPKPAYLSSTMPYPALSDGAQPLDSFGDGAGGVDNRHYHREAITDADAQFEDIETTLAHLFRFPHVALGGRRYGDALIDGLRKIGRLRTGSLRVLEIGAGSGALCEAAIERLIAEGDTVQWTIIDISPALRAAQIKRLSRFGDQVRVVDGDAESLNLVDGSFDLVIANEMVGDLTSDRLGRGELAKNSEQPSKRGLEKPALTLISRYKLDCSDAPDPFWLNSGAIRLVERVAKLLAPDGVCWVSEFGHRDAWPVESTQLDHAEVSIQFGLLAAVAKQCGLQTQIAEVGEVIGLDPEPLALVTTSTFFRNLRALAASRGVELDKRAWTQQALVAQLGAKLPAARVGNLRFVPIGERVMGLRPPEFLALVATRG